MGVRSSKISLCRAYVSFMMLRCCLGGVDGKHDSCQNERRSFKECLNKNVFFFGLRKKRDKVDVKSVKISIYTV